MSRPTVGDHHVANWRRYAGELEAELKWLQNQHVKKCSSEDRIRRERDALKEAVRVRDTATEPPTEEDRVLAFMELMGGDHAWIEVSTRIFLADTHAMPKWLPLPILKENDSE